MVLGHLKHQEYKLLPTAFNGSRMSKIVPAPKNCLKIQLLALVLVRVLWDLGPARCRETHSQLTGGVAQSRVTNSSQEAYRAHSKRESCRLVITILFVQENQGQQQREKQRTSFQPDSFISFHSLFAQP